VSSTLVIVVAAIVAVAAVIAVLFAVVSVSRRRTLRDRFGPEYARTVQASSNPRRAEAALRSRVEERNQLSLRPLDTSERDRYEQEWERVQAAFVDAPTQSVDQADALVTAVMTAQGYPVRDFDERADLVSVDHPEVVQHYRRAHGIFAANKQAQVPTDDLRLAFVSYRSLFANLLHDEPAPSASGRPGGV
jgi:hypothetical protein